MVHIIKKELNIEEALKKKLEFICNAEYKIKKSSKNTIPERGYERAKRFINEFNKKLGLTLST